MVSSADSSQVAASQITYVQPTPIAKIDVV